MNLTRLKIFGNNFARNVARADVDVVSTAKTRNLRKSYTQISFKDYCNRIVTLMLQKKNPTQLRDLWVKWLKALKVMRFDKLMGGQVQLQFRINMKLLEETDDPESLKMKLTEVKSYTETGKLLYHHPPPVKARIGYYIDVIDAIDKLLIHDRELISAWESLASALTGWLQASYIDTVKSFKNVIAISAKKLSELEPGKIEDFKNKLKLLVGPSHAFSLAL